jgi:hypothetical protein
MMPAARAAPEDLFVTIGWAYGLPEATVAVSVVQAAGIPVHSATFHVAGVATHWMVLLGGIELRVPVHSAQAALACLAGEEAVPPRRRSAACKLLLIVLFLLSSVPAPPGGLFLRSLPSGFADKRSPALT